MNKPETQILDAAAAHLRATGLAVTIKKTRPTERVDAWVRIAKDRTKVDYAVEVKRQVTPHTLGAVVAQMKHHRELTRQPPLLVTTHVTRPMADQLAAIDQQFVDAAGNAYLDAPGIFVFMTGQKPDRDVFAEKTGDAFTTAGLKTLFVLICNPQLAAAPYREIAAAANVALGALPRTLQALQQTGHLHTTSKQRKLIATKRLLDEWALAYARRLRPKQMLKTMITPAFKGWRKWDLQADHAKWGGEPAGALITKHLEPGVLTIYAQKIPARLAVEHRMIAARPNEEHNLVDIRKPFWGDLAGPENRPDVVPLPLVYADLLATGDARCIEAAQILYENRLARHFPPA